MNLALFIPADPDDVGAAWARLLTTVAGELGLPDLASELARWGASNETLRIAAGDWRAYTLEPPDVAAVLRALAEHYPDPIEDN